MLFERRLREGLASGQVTVAFRRWRRPQVTTGGVYRVSGSPLRVTAEEVDLVTTAELSAADARDAGYPGVGDLLAALRGDEANPLYRVRFRVVDEPDPREVLRAQSTLAVEDFQALQQRLARLDAAPTGPGPWTAATLALIAERPGVVAAELAAALGQERLPFKRRVRGLKALGLTESLAVGYRLSPRGTAYLAHLQG